MLCGGEKLVPADIFVLSLRDSVSLLCLATPLLAAYRACNARSGCHGGEKASTCLDNLADANESTLSGLLHTYARILLCQIKRNGLNILNPVGMVNLRHKKHQAEWLDDAALRRTKYVDAPPVAC